MHSLKLTICLSFLAAGTSSAAGASEATSHAVYARDFPSYCQEDSTSCGAATMQMVFAGNRRHKYQYAQEYIRKKTPRSSDPGGEWASDPDAVRFVLTKYGPKIGVIWEAAASDDYAVTLFDIVYWMTTTEIPVPTLVFGLKHWVLVTGIETDRNPTKNKSINLSYIQITDPWRDEDVVCTNGAGGGVRSFMPASTWRSEYWDPALDLAIASKWHAKYVAILENPRSPNVRGAAIVPTTKDDPVEVTPTGARERAMSYVSSMEAFSRPPYDVFRKSRALQAHLVSAYKRDYYLVPFSVEGLAEGSAMDARGAILIDAATGRFQEAGVFPTPVTYTSAETAVERARRYQSLHIDGVAKVRLVFFPSDQTMSRFFPLWELTVDGDRQIYLSQTGRVYLEITAKSLGR